MHSLAFVTLIALSSAAQLPSSVYLPQNQGGFQGTFSQSQSFQSSQGFQSAHSNLVGSGDTGNRRPQQEQEKNAQIIKQDQEINENGFHYNYETSNGIKAEEGGNAAQTQGGFSYTGDDGNTYTVTFTAGEGGFQPQGAHLPVPPPIPQEIVEALQQNEKDEAAGIFDDGKYHPDIHGGGQNKPGQSGGSFSSSSSSYTFGSSSHQSGFNANTGYKY